MTANTPTQEWTASENATLKHLVELGVDDPEIGDRLGKSAMAVRGRRLRMHLSRGGQRAFVWKEAETARLIELWATKIPGAQIARLMTEEFGRAFTKNAIIGRAHRLDQPSHKASPRKERTPRRRVKAFKPAKPFAFSWAPPPPPAEDHAWQLFSELQGPACHFIQGEPRGFETLMCGLPVAMGSYCGYHHWMTHQKAPAGGLRGRSFPGPSLPGKEAASI